MLRGCRLGVSGVVLLALLYSSPAYCHPPLQLFIALTPEGGTLHLQPGTYSGPAVIDRPITIEGGPDVVIDGGGNGTVISVRADKVRLHGLHVTHSGNSHDQVDAGILLEANEAQIEGNVIDDVLFGIHVKKAHDNIIRGNRISSRAVAPTLRGDGLRLWYSSNNLFEDNRFEQVRDLYITNSPDNEFVANTVRNSRVAMEFVFSPGNRVERSTIERDGRGVVIIYSDGLQVIGNRFSHLRSYAGSALSLKESSQVVIEGNQILHCAVGVTANAPIQPENIFYMRNNHFAFNDIALYFYGEKGGHVIQGNHFEKNEHQVAVSSPVSARLQKWEGNQWDDYRGFDLDQDGTGDTPYEVYLYSDRIWMDRPMTQFFRGSPVMDIIDFIERLAPFSSPALVLRDPVPQVQ